MISTRTTGSRELILQQVFGITPSITYFAIGVIILAFGYAIRYHQMTGLIVGIDPARAEDEEGLANLIGGALIVISIITFVYGIIPPQGFSDTNLETVYTALVLILTITSLLIARWRYM